MVKHDQQWLAMWVAETHNCPHFHVLLHVDDDVATDFIGELAAWARCRFQWLEVTLEQAVRRICEPENGLDVQVTEIHPDRVHQQSGLAGFDGMVE